MKVQKLKQGEEATLPCSVAGKKNSEGWTIAPAPSDGLMILLNVKEWGAGGVFIDDKILEESGYLHINGDLRQNLVDKFPKKELIKILHVLDARSAVRSANKDNKKNIAGKIIKTILNLK